MAFSRRVAAWRAPAGDRNAPAHGRQGMPFFAKGRRRAIRAGLIIAAAFCTSALAAAEQADSGDRKSRPACIDDILAMEAIGPAAFSPDGRWLVYTLVPPYWTLKDYSYWMRAQGLSGHQIRIRAVDSAGPGRLHPGLDPGASNYFLGFSPDSKHFIALEHRTGRYQLAACVTAGNTCRRFDVLPDIRDRYIAALQWNERLVWTGPGRFVMPVRDALMPGSEMRSRAIAASFLSSAWQNAWQGGVPTASEVISTGADRWEDWAPGRLMEFHVATGETRVIAEGRFAGVTASPDGRYLLAAKVGERIRPFEFARPVPAETHPIFDRRYAPYLIDTRTRSLRPLDGPDQADPGSFAWHRRSEAFAFFGWNREDLPEQGRFYLARPADPSGTALSHQPLTLTPGLPHVDFSWWPGPARAVLLDEGLAVHGKPYLEGPEGWYLLSPGAEMIHLSEGLAGVSSEPLFVSVGGFGALANGGAYILSAGSNPVLIEGPLSGEWSAPVRRSSPDHGWSGEIHPESPLIRQDLRDEAAILAGDASGGAQVVLFIGSGTASFVRTKIDMGLAGGRVLAASRSAGRLLLTVKDGAATQLLLTDTAGPAEELARINTHLNDIRPPAIRKVAYLLEDPDGRYSPRPVEACLFLPDGFDPARRYPLLLEVYPMGTAGGCATLADTPKSGFAPEELWTARGFIYVRPALPLDIAVAPDDPLGNYGHLVDQTIEALASNSGIDPDRVVVFGFSQGGAAALVAAVQARRPSAIISMNGWANYLSHYFGARGLMRYFHLDQNGGDNRWRYECRREGPSHICPFGFGQSAFEDATRYALASPVVRAEEVTAPVMLVHSDFDYFDMAQYDEMFGALYRAGKEARYVRYWGEGHGPSSPANIRDLWSRIDEFLLDAGILDSGETPFRRRPDTPSTLATRPQ